MSEHLGDGEAIGCGLPAGVFVFQFAHEAAENVRRSLEEVEAGQSVLGHRFMVAQQRESRLDVLASGPSNRRVKASDLALTVLPGEHHTKVTKPYMPH